MPASSRILATATPAAPAPEITTRVDPGFAAGQLQRVGERGQRDDRGAVLVVVEDRDVEPLLEPVLDLEAARRRDVLEVDAAEGRRQPDDRLDDLLDVGGVEADRDGVDAAERLEQDRLALHHRHRRGRADVAQPEHRGAVGDHRDRVGHPRVVPGQRRVLGDGLAHPRDARRVGQREVVAAAQADGGTYLHLAAHVQVEDRVASEGMGGVRHRSSLAQRRRRHQRPDPAYDHGEDVVVGDRAVAPRVRALLGVVAEQPPARLAQLGRTPLGRPLDRERHHRAGGRPRRPPDAGSAGSRAAAGRPGTRVGRIESLTTRARPQRGVRVPVPGYRSVAARHAE